MSRKPSPGNDRIRGSELADTIDALAGNDAIFGRGGDDNLSGGVGSDSIRGGEGNDTIFAGEDSSDDLNQLFGDNGRDSITGSLGLDSIFGGADRDILSGGGNTDFIEGQDGSDRLMGGTGDDVLIGGNGDDTLIGVGEDDDGKGQIDVLIGFNTFSNGESDRDLFVLGDRERVFYDDGNSNTQGEADFAVIQDFVDRQDAIQLNKDVDYRLENVDVRGAGKGVGIFVDNSGSTADELIGVVEDGDISQLTIINSRTAKFIV